MEEGTEKKEPEVGGSPPPEPVTISLGEVWSKIRQQPLHEKLFTWGALIYTLTGLLPPFPWSNPFVGLATLIVFCGLVVHVGGLVRIGPGGSDPFWRFYAYAGAVAAGLGLLAILIQLPAIGSWSVGFLAGLLALAVHAWATYRICDRRKLLPFRITR